jgi:hypothetical protein
METDLPIRHFDICTHSANKIEKDNDRLKNLFQSISEEESPDHLKNKIQKISDNFKNPEIKYSEKDFDTPPIGEYDSVVIDTVDDRLHCHTHIGTNKIEEVIGFHQKSISQLNKVDLSHMNAFINMEIDKVDIPVSTIDKHDIKMDSITYTFNDNGDQFTVGKTDNEARIHAQTNKDNIQPEDLKETVGSKLTQIERHIEEVLQ